MSGKAKMLNSREAASANRTWAAVLALLLMTACLISLLAIPARAQDEAADVPVPEVAEPTVPPADPAPPADNAAANNAQQPPAATDGEATGEPESMLAFFFRALGPLYTVAFLGLSFALVALIVMNLVGARRSNVIPVELVEAFEENLNGKRYQEAYELAKNDDSFLGHVLSAGLGRISSGYAPAIEAMQEVGEEETMKMEHRLSYIGLIGAISPMVGLLGTVDGMVASFMVIARATQAPKPSELASGISTALITTLVGLWLAIPAIAIYGILRNRVQRLTLEVGVVGEQLMSRFQNVGTKKA